MICLEALLWAIEKQMYDAWNDASICFIGDTGSNVGGVWRQAGGCMQLLLLQT